MKVLHIIDSLGLGGAQTVVKGLFEVQKDNRDLYLYALRRRKITTAIDHPNVRICGSRGKYSLRPLFELRAIIADREIDIIHCHLLRSNITGWILKRFWFPRIKLVIHEHGSVAIDGALYANALRVSQKSVNAYVAVSEAMRDALAERGIAADKISVIYNFIDTATINRNNITWNPAEERRRLGIPAGAFVAGFAGRLSEEKGWRDFLEAACLVAKLLPNAYFAIAGDGKDKEQLMRFVAQRGLKNRAIVLGHVKNIVWFYSIIDCLVVPSRRESFGLAALEAQAMRVPVIAADVAGLSEVVIDGETGCLYRGGDVRQLGEAIARVCTEGAGLSDERIARHVRTFERQASLSCLRRLYEML